MTGNQQFRWGIIAPGRIAHNFARALAVLPDATLAAVASRNASRGQAFADQYAENGVSARVYEDYAELVQDPEIDAVYIANPHRFHADSVALCLAAHKPVLCEKPLTVNAEQAERLFAVAEDRGLFVMEALWSRFLPVWDQVKQWLQTDAIGAVHTIQSEFCIDVPFDAKDRLYDLEQAGGALLDLGVYCVSLSNYVMGRNPDRVQSALVRGETGVDVRTSALLSYGEAVSAFTCGVKTERSNGMRIEGESGVIELGGPFLATTEVTLTRSGGEPEVHRLPYDSSGFQFQIAAAMADIRAGRTQNDRIPWADTLATSRIMDQILAEGGVRYPFL